MFFLPPLTALLGYLLQNSYIYILYISQKIAIFNLWTVCPCFSILRNMDFEGIFGSGRSDPDPSFFKNRVQIRQKHPDSQPCYQAIKLSIKGNAEQGITQFYDCDVGFLYEARYSHKGRSHRYIC